MPDHVEALIVGGGPAGMAAAINLAPFRRTALIERRAAPAARIGESLVPAARRLLADMGLLERFLAEGHELWHGRRLVWGRRETTEEDFLRDPDGSGWHLDRARFERWLQAEGRARGAATLLSTRLEDLRHDGAGWRARLTTPEGPRVMTANLVIDAGGRSALVARQHGGIQRRVGGRLVCAWAHGHDEWAGQRGLTFVEAVQDGWWYTAPLPCGRRALAFHTDADLLPSGHLCADGALLARVEPDGELAALLNEAGFIPESPVRLTSAHSVMLSPAACENGCWLAAGDAAVSFDPLASRGLFNALYTGLAAAEAAHRHLAGDPATLPQYAREIERIAAVGERQTERCYADETRWPDAPFWRRRRGTRGLDPGSG